MRTRKGRWIYNILTTGLELQMLGVLCEGQKTGWGGGFRINGAFMSRLEAFRKMDI